MDGAPLVCAICGVAGSAHEFFTIGTKGSKGINRASGLRNDSISVVPEQHVHPNCRRDYCHSTNISKDNRSRENAGSQSATIQRRRSADQTFDYIFFIISSFYFFKKLHILKLGWAADSSASLGGPVDQLLQIIYYYFYYY